MVSLPDGPVPGLRVRGPCNLRSCAARGGGRGRVVGSLGCTAPGRAGFLPVPHTSGPTLNREEGPWFPLNPKPEPRPRRANPLWGPFQILTPSALPPPKPPPHTRGRTGRVRIRPFHCTSCGAHHQMACCNTPSCCIGRVGEIKRGAEKWLRGSPLPLHPKLGNPLFQWCQ